MAIPAPLSVDNLERGCAVVVSTAAVPRYRTSPRREAWRCLCVAMAAIVLAACGSKPTVPQKIEMEFEVTTAGSINPDVNGRSSPLVLVIMQLRAQDKFASADFFSLFDPDAAILGDDLLGRDQLTLVPDATRTIPMELNPETQFLGVVAAFSNLETSTWRDVVEIPQKSLLDKANFFSKDRAMIVVEDRAVAISFGSK